MAGTVVAPSNDELTTTAPQEIVPDTQASAAMAKAQAEIQSSVVLAKRYPRNEEACYAKLMKACDRHSFADASAYEFKRGKSLVTGASAPFAREFARIWGNIRFGLRVLRDTDDSRLIQGWAWDLETNAYNEADDEFGKLIQRKLKDRHGNETGETIWVQPDERDLRELTNRRGAILVRNCILSIVPKDMVEDALKRCDATIEKGAKNDPDAWKKILTAFADINVSGNQLAQFLSHSVAEASPTELAQLRRIWQSISQGASTWQEYCETTPNGKAASAGQNAEQALAAKLQKEKEAEEQRKAEAARLEQEQKVRAWHKQLVESGACAAGTDELGYCKLAKGHTGGHQMVPVLSSLDEPQQEATQEATETAEEAQAEPQLASPAIEFGNHAQETTEAQDARPQTRQKRRY